MIHIPEKTEAEKKAQKKYMSKFTIINVRMEPEKKQRLQDHANNQGESVNEYINKAIDERIDRERNGE